MESEHLWDDVLRGPGSLCNSYADLMALVFAVPGVDTYDDPRLGQRHLSRKDALEYERKVQAAPKLPQSVYVLNRSNEYIHEVPDLSINPGDVLDLSSVCATTLKRSTDLPLLFAENSLVFIGKAIYLKVVAADVPPSYPKAPAVPEAFASWEEGMAFMSGKISSVFAEMQEMLKKRLP